MEDIINLKDYKATANSFLYKIDAYFKRILPTPSTIDRTIIAENIAAERFILKELTSSLNERLKLLDNDIAPITSMYAPVQTMSRNGRRKSPNYRKFSSDEVSLMKTRVDNGETHTKVGLTYNISGSKVGTLLKSHF